MKIALLLPFFTRVPRDRVILGRAANIVILGSGLPPAVVTRTLGLILAYLAVSTVERLAILICPVL